MRNAVLEVDDQVAFESVCSGTKASLIITCSYAPILVTVLSTKLIAWALIIQYRFLDEYLPFWLLLIKADLFKCAVCLHRKCELC